MRIKYPTSFDKCTEEERARLAKTSFDRILRKRNKRKRELKEDEPNPERPEKSHSSENPDSKLKTHRKCGSIEEGKPVAQPVQNTGKENLNRIDPLDKWERGLI